ncbi:hypothetical protein GE09DRAFT_1061555 [Coniochaeta sp. 2T2.1]|nr:hypothetical protein GE09DRAFT_1061555 [Coniochaeta sp. 2T2.1]
MKYTVYLSSLVYTAIAQGAALNLTSRQDFPTPNTECDGSRVPNLLDCDELVRYLGWDKAGPDAQVERPRSIPPKPNRADHHLNCEIVIWWSGFTSPAKVRDIMNGIETVKQICIIPEHAGGDTWDANAFETGVFNDRDFDPQRSAGESTVVVRQELNYADVVARQERADVVARQEPAYDSFALGSVSRNIQRDDQLVQVSPSMPAGSTYTVTKGNEWSKTVSANFDVGGTLWGIFQIGASAGFESTHTVYNEESTELLVDCESGQNGAIYWGLLWDRYSGTFQVKDNPTAGTKSVTVFDPQEDSAGRYIVRCEG